MKPYKGAVMSYTKATASITVFFPDKDVCCQWCKFCRPETQLNRYWCRLTNDMIYAPDTDIGENCPLVIK